jgi:hypothetical protein
MAEGQGPLRHRVGEGDALLKVRPGGGVFAQEQQDSSERIIGLQARRWGGHALRQTVELFPQLLRRRQRPPGLIKPT